MKEQQEQWLEGIPQAQLKLTLAPLRCDFPERCTSRSRIGGTTVFTAPVGMVDEVEHLTTKLQFVPFADLKPLEDAQVPVLEASSVDEVPVSLGRKGSSCWRCEQWGPIGISGPKPEVLITRCE